MVLIIIGPFLPLVIGRRSRGIIQRVDGSDIIAINQAAYIGVIITQSIQPIINSGDPETLIKKIHIFHEH
jgi:hypothetical protein